MSLRTDLEKLPDRYWHNANIKIKPLSTESDLLYATLDCHLTDEQRELVNPAWFCIGRAYLFRDDHFPCIILNARNEPVGFISLCKWLGSGDAYSWSYFIDKDHQGKGHGLHAAQLAIRILKAANPARQIKLATEARNIKAQKLYRSLGFELLPEMDGDDIVFGL